MDSKAFCTSLTSSHTTFSIASKLKPQLAFLSFNTLFPPQGLRIYYSAYL